MERSPCRSRTPNDKPVAIVTDIQRYSLHDGPGIRTVVFFKGCPLSCKWCQNPETNRMDAEILFTQEYCIGCGACIEACKYRYISGWRGTLTTDPKCTHCGDCTRVCPSKTRKLVGEEYTLDSLLAILLRDSVFYRNSGGGVTLSGGEVTAQYTFATLLLDKLKKAGIHSAIETCGYASESVMINIALGTDLILFDLKHPNAQQHAFYTGVDNKRILRNLDMILERKRPVIIRLPLIPGANDDSETLRQTAQLCLARGIHEMHLLPFHQGGQSKWHGLNRPYAFKNTPSLGPRQIEEAQKLLESFGLSVNVGGMD